MGSPSSPSNAPGCKPATAFSRQGHPRYKSVYSAALFCVTRLTKVEAKRCRHDLHGTCPFGDSCSYIHASHTMLAGPFAMSPVREPYAGYTAVSPLLQDAVLPPMSPYMLGTVHRHPEEPETAVAFVPYASPSLPMDFNETFRALSMSNAPQRQRKPSSSGVRACHYRSQSVIILNPALC